MEMVCEGWEGGGEGMHMSVGEGTSNDTNSEFSYALAVPLVLFPGE